MVSGASRELWAEAVAGRTTW